jgi:hypothetical protein
LELNSNKKTERAKRKKGKKALQLEVEEQVVAAGQISSIHLPSIVSRRGNSLSLFGRTLSGELRLMLKGTAWCAGWIVALITGAGVTIRLSAGGQTDALLAWMPGSLFIPSLALAFLGRWRQIR